MTSSSRQRPPFASGTSPGALTGRWRSASRTRGLGCWLQLRLFEARLNFTRFNESTDTDLTNPWLTWAVYLAHLRGEGRGWRPGVSRGVRHGLTTVLSGHRR